MPDKADNDTYNDIIDLTYPFQLKHPRMTPDNRAAQFSAFAALSGHEAAISETARLTDKRIDLDEGRKHILNAKLQIISENILEVPIITITYFLPDDRKDGGTYRTITESVKKVNEHEKTIVTTTGRVIPIEDIYALEGEMFCRLEDSND